MNMKANASRPGKDKAFPFVMIAYVVLALGLVGFYRYQLGPDGVPYISIAEKYAAGDWQNAVNGYWGPLISWLLVPFLLLGLPALLSTKLLTLCIGFFAIIGLRRMLDRFELSDSLRRAILLSSVIIVLEFALWIFTPDLLLSCILLYYFSIVFRGDYPGGARKGSLCGMIGALAYLAKAYAVPFFLCHFTIMNVLHYLASPESKKRKTVIRSFVLGVVVFVVLVSPWVYTISSKYDTVTVGMGGRYSWRVVGPESKGQAVVSLGFLVPSNETAISGWEDPCTIEMPAWSPFESRANLLHAVRNVLRNVKRIMMVCASFSVLSAAILFGYVLLCAVPLKKGMFRQAAIYPLMTVVLYAGGFLIYLVESRYLWPLCFLLLPMGGHLLHRLLKSDFFDPLRTKIAIGVFVLSFIAIPLAQLIRDMNVGKDLYLISRTLDEHCEIKGRVASNMNWSETLKVSYHLNLRYYGVPKPGAGEKELEAELRKHGIEFFFVWDEEGEEISFLSEHEEVTGGKVAGLRVYRMGSD